MPLVHSAILGRVLYLQFSSCTLRRNLAPKTFKSNNSHIPAVAKCPTCWHNQFLSSIPARLTLVKGFPILAPLIKKPVLPYRLSDFHLPFLWSIHTCSKSINTRASSELPAPPYDLEREASAEDRKHAYSQKASVTNRLSIWAISSHNRYIIWKMFRSLRHKHLICRVWLIGIGIRPPPIKYYRDHAVIPFTLLHPAHDICPSPTTL